MISLKVNDVHEAIEALAYYNCFNDVTVFTAVKDAQKMLANNESPDKALEVLESLVAESPLDYDVIVCGNEPLFNIYSNSKRTPIIYYKDTPHNVKLYVDLDGVMADFQGFFNAKGVREINWMVDIVDPISKGKKVFSVFNLVEGAAEFYEMIKHAKPIFYTATGYTEEVAIRKQKEEWVEKYFPGNKVVFCQLGKTKAKLRATSNAILIDDSEENCIKWKEHHGVPLLFNHKEISFKALYLQLIEAYNEIMERDKKLRG